jgi:hypothetical protein
MIGCTEYLEMMNAFMDGELDEESRAELSEHLRYCPGCFNASLAYKSINEAIADGETEPPDALLPSVMNRISAHKKRLAVRPLKTIGALAAVIVFVIVTAIAAPQLLNRKKGTADSSAAPDMLFSAMDSGIKQAESAPEAPQVEMDGGGSSVEGALSGEQDDSSALTAGENIETGSEGSPRDPGQAAAPGSKNDSSPVEINGYTCSAIIVLDPEVSPPDVFDQYTYYSWQESHSLYLIISGDLYDELIDSLDNLKIDYNLELYSEITSDGWILLITSAQ